MSNLVVGFHKAVAAASTANVAGTFVAGATPQFDTLTGAMAALAVDGVTLVLNDRVLLKDQTTATQNGVYVVTTPGSAASGVGPIATTGSLVAGSGYVSGTYTGVPLAGGTGTGAVGTVVVSGPGTIYAYSSLVGGADYVDGQYVAVPLTGGAGTGAEATVLVQGGAVTYVTITNVGTGYAINDVLSAADADLGNGGSGAGFAITVTKVVAGVASITVTSPGTGYTVADVLTLPVYIGGGTGASKAVATVAPSAWVLTRASDAAYNSTMPGLAVFALGGTVNTGAAWVQNVPVVVLNTTDLVFTNFVVAI